VFQPSTTTQRPGSLTSSGAGVLGVVAAVLAGRQVRNGGNGQVRWRRKVGSRQNKVVWGIAGKLGKALS